MLDHVQAAGPGDSACAHAIDHVLNEDNVRTGDLGGSAGTAAFAKAIASRIANG